MCVYRVEGLYKTVQMDVVLIDMLDVQSVLWLNNIELLYFLFVET